MTGRWRVWVDGLLAACTRLPYPEVHQGWGRPLTAREGRQALKRYLHKRLVLALTGQSTLMRRQAPVGRRVLMYYAGADNIGDAFMDLAGFQLLVGSGWQVDLLADPQLVPLFEQDAAFGRVYGDPADIDPAAYGFVILNNLNLRTLKSKRRWLPGTPFCSMVGFFYGIDYNHIELGYFAVNDVFGLGIPARRLCAEARPCLPATDTRYLAARAALSQVMDVRPVMAVAVGGREAYRTYAHWPEVLSALDRPGEPWSGWRFVLIGSDNGIIDAGAVTKRSFQHIAVESQVAQTDLFQCRALLAGAVGFLGADGGLMHLAHTVGTPTVSLFAREVRPEMRLTPACRSVPLHSDGDVSTIPPDEVVRALRLMLARYQPERLRAATARSGDLA